MLTLFLLILSMTVETFAVEVEIDGLWYEIVLKTGDTKVIQYKDNRRYSGNIVIPETVEYENKVFSVTSIGDHAFEYCYGLNSVLIGNRVKSIGYCAFSLCNKLTSVVIPNSVEAIGGWAFSGCGGLTSVTISNNVTSIEDAVFRGCSSLTSVIIPNSVLTIGYEAFQNCSGLITVTLSNGITGIGGYSFDGCSNLSAITFPSGVEYIGTSAFRNCRDLISVTIPNSIMTIGSQAFYGCIDLTTITIGSGVKTIGRKAFANCRELTDVYCYATNVPSIINDYGVPCSDAFEDSYIEYATLHVPTASFDAYTTVEPWKNFKNIVALTDSDPQPNSINVVINDGSKTNAYYDLSGRKVLIPQKGFYIMNGKKYIMK